MGYKEIPIVAALSYLYNQDKDVYLEYNGNYTKVVQVSGPLDLHRSNRFYIYEEEYKQISFKEALRLWLNGNESVFYRPKNNPSRLMSKADNVPTHLSILPYYFCYPEIYVYFIEK